MPGAPPIEGAGDRETVFVAGGFMFFLADSHTQLQCVELCTRTAGSDGNRRSRRKEADCLRSSAGWLGHTSRPDKGGR